MKEHHIIGVCISLPILKLENPCKIQLFIIENNVVGSYHLIESARTAGVKHFVFSSTAAVYGGTKGSANS